MGNKPVDLSFFLSNNLNLVFTMFYPKSPDTPTEALQYAIYLSERHGKQFYAIRRTVPIRGRFALNFTAVDEEELGHYLEYDGWEVVSRGNEFPI